MRLRTLLAAVLVAAAMQTATAVEAAPPLPQPETPASAEGLVARFGFAQMFASLGDSLAAGPRLGGVADERFLAAWEASAHAAFASPALPAGLSAALTRALTAADVAGIEAFLDSPLGQRIAALERAVQQHPPAQRIGLIARGEALWIGLPQARRSRLEEVLALTGADLSFQVLAQSLRGLAVGLSLATAGDLAVAWAGADGEVDRRLAGMEASLGEAARGVAALTYADLSDAELEAYLDFLRADSTRRFYATATTAIAGIVDQTMHALAETVARRLERVGV